ncbi:Protein disabled like protein [Argiope bruennichi]|uniref:Protein disabled like protein n=1 Tax=Argiope bruennichi TaxID=94029 RepID=A0A8T0G4X7_ARGBR|nr:Protein disabled like protein [Argiope bruennichi]
MKPFILSDNAIYRIKEALQNEMTLGLLKTANLPMTVTFVTERVTEADGDYVAICAHAQNFSITLVKLRPDALPETYRKDYEIDTSVFNLSYRKIYEAFADCMKDFFYEFQLGGAAIPVGFCSNLPMRHFSLDTAIIPSFGVHSALNPCQKDVKSYFEQILCTYDYQRNTHRSSSSSSFTASSPSEGSDNSSEIHQVQFDAKLLGCESVLGLDISPETCHKLLDKLKIFLNAGKALKDVILEISPTGVQIQDKHLKDVLHHHFLNKISHITQDFANNHAFGYIFGDYVKGHQFFAFITICESTQVVLYLHETFLLEILQKKKEELNMKASQVFLTLKNFLNVAQDLKVKEREIPSTLKKRVNLVENIFWWLEGCSGDVTPTCLETQESTLNVRIQELYTTAVTMKLIEREQEEEALLRKAKAAKRHLRKKKPQQVDAKRTDDYVSEKTSDPLQIKVIQLLQKYADEFRSVLEDRKIKLELLKDKAPELISGDVTDESIGEAIKFLEKFCCDVHQEIEMEINYVKEKIESIVFAENEERINIQPKGSTINLGGKQFLKSVQIKPKENIFEEFSVPASRSSSEISEVLNKIEKCKEYFLNALKIRKEEVNELKYLISGLHFREDRLPSEETAAVILPRKLLVTTAKLHLREIINIESHLLKLSDAENQVVFAVPNVLQYCKDIYDLNLSRLEKRYKEISDDNNKNEVLPVVYTLKDLFDVVSFGLKQKRIEKSDDPTGDKTLQIYTSLEEFLLVAFDLKQKAMEIPLEVLKSELEKVLSNLISKIKEREMQRISERKRHLKALKISNSWKKVFLTAAEIRKAEIMKVIPAKIKEEKEEEAIIRMLKSDERLNVDNEGRQLSTSWRKIFIHVNDMKRREIEQIKQLLYETENSNFNEQEEKHETTGIDTLEEEYLQIIGEEEEECPHAELLRVISTCKSIFQIVIEKGTAELEELEHDMRPIFNPEYDEENIEYEEDEITKALNKTKQILQDHYNIKTQVSLAQETTKRYLLFQLDKVENGIKVLSDKMETLDHAFQDLMTMPSEEIRPFTDLVVEVLSSEDIHRSEDNQDESSQLQPSELEGKKSSSKFTREQIEALLLEIEAEQKGDDEVEDPYKLEALNIYKECKSFFKSALDLRKKNLEILESDLEKFERSFSKKPKKNEKQRKALSNIKACRERMNYGLETLQSELKFLQHQFEKIAKAYPKEQEVMEIKPSEIVASSRKLFSTFVEARKTNLHLMDVELGLLLAKENSLLSQQCINVETADITRTEILDSCKDLVIGFVDIKMKEVDEISNSLNALDEIERKIEDQLSHLDSEEMKASYTKLEKVKDAVSTCKKLSVSASEKAKRGLKDADKVLRMLKDVLDVVEESVVSSTCTYLLKSNIEKRESEIYAITKVLKTMEAGLKNLEVTEQDIEDYLNTRDLGTVMPEVLPSIPLTAADKRKSAKILFSHVEKEEESSSSDTDGRTEQLNFEVSSTNIEEIKNTLGLIKVEEFRKQALGYLQARLLTKCEEIEQIQADLDKLKVTVANVEKEDSKVFDICQNIIFKSVEMLKAESQAAANELKNLEKVNIEEIHSDIDEVEFASSCKRTLMNAIKNRNTQHNLIEFELMKLVRYQDSRIVQICKDQLLFLQKSSNEEAFAIKEKIKKLERTGYKQELYEMCRKDIQEFIQMVNGTIQLTESVLQSIKEKKMKIELEDAQFVAVCRNLFLSQMMQRKKEMSLYKQTADQVNETTLTIENMNEEANFIFRIIYGIPEHARSIRRLEKEQIECEIIKKMDINVSEAVNDCEKFFVEMSESLKDELYEFKKELDDISGKKEQVCNFSIEEFSALITKYSNYILSVIEKNVDSEKELKKKVNSLRGKHDTIKIEKVNMDALNASNTETSQKKLKTEASDLLSLCTEVLCYIIENFKIGIKDIKIALEELQTLKEPISKKTMKPLSETLPANHNYTAKQIALLEELEQEILNSETGKEELEFCEHIYITTIDRKEEKIQIFKQILEKLNNVKIDLSSKAANLVYGWRSLCSMIHDTFIEQNAMLENEVIVAKSIHQERERTVEKYEDAVCLVISMLEENLGEILLNLQELRNKDLELKEQIACTYSLESLKKYNSVSEGNPDMKELSDVEKIVVRCKHLMQMSVKLRKEGIHALNLQLKFFMGKSQESRQRKSLALPSWQERFLSFMNMEKDNFDIRKQILFEGSAMNEIEQGDKSLKFTEDQAESEMKAKLMMYKDLLLSIEHKRLKQPSYCISAWNDIFVEAFLLEQLKSHEGLDIKEFTEIDSTESSTKLNAFHSEYSWDELMRQVTTIVSRQMKIASFLQSKKRTFIPLLPWKEILRKAICSWNALIYDEMATKRQENTLLQWKSRMTPKEYSEYVAGYQYGSGDDKGGTHTDDYIMNFMVDMKALISVLDRSVIGENTSNHDKQKAFVPNSWEDIFDDAYSIIKEGNQLIHKLKKQDMRIQYQAARYHSSWSDCFFKAVGARKEELREEFKENSLLQSVAKRIREKMQSGIQKQALDFMTLDSESWTEKISEMFHAYKEELTEAVNIKRQEMKQNPVLNKPITWEDKIEENPFFKTEVIYLCYGELIKQGKRMFTLALDIRNSEKSSMEKILKNFRLEEKAFGDDTEKTNEPVYIWKKILSSAIDFIKKGLPFHQQRRKHSFKSEELFSIAEKKLTKELDTGIMQEEKSRGELQFFPEDEKHSALWDGIFQTVYNLLAKDLEKAEKLGLKEIKSKEGAEKEYLEDNFDDFPHWIDIFLDAADQEIKEMNPNQIDLHQILEENLLSEVRPSWNEILYIFSNYNQEEIKKRLFINNRNTLADRTELSNLKLLVSHRNFNWDHIIVAAIEEFLKINENRCDENLVESSESKRHFVLALLENKFQKMNQLHDEDESAKHSENCKWIDLLPTKETESKFQVEEELLETKIILENPTSYFKKEKIPDDLLWKRIFPFAVLVWKRNLGDYLKFSKMSSMEKLAGTTYSKTDELKLLKEKLHQEQQRIKKFTNDISLKSKKLIEERFDLKDSNSISEYDSEKKTSVSAISHNFSTTKQIDSYEPQYFSVTASWKEVFFAAVERNRKILYKLVEFKKFDEANEHEVAEKRFQQNENESLKTHNFGQEELKDLFTVQNVLNLPITLRELFDTTTVLQQKKLVLFSQSFDEDFNKISEAKQKLTGTFKAFDVIDNFKHIFARGLLMRKKEIAMLERELQKLDNNEKATSILAILCNYYNMASKIREKENKIILHELELLNDFKDIFTGYMDFSANQSLRLRNKHHIRLLKQEYQNIQFVRTDFERKLISHLDRCVRNFESSVDKRNDHKFQVDMKAMDSLLKNLNLKEQELLSAAKRVLTSISELRKAEIKHLEIEMKSLKKETFESTMENKVTQLLSVVIPFVSNGLDERKNLQSLLIQAIDFIKDAETNVYNKVRSASILSKELLLNAIQNNRSEIETMENAVNNLKSKVDCKKKKVAKVMTACENYIDKMAEKRKSEIQLVETYLREMKYIQVAEFHSRCTQYFVNALEKRKQEIIDIEVLTEPLKEKEEELDSEMSSAIDEALCDAFGIHQGMTFFKIQEEKKEIEVAKLDPQTITLFSEFYSTLVESINKDINNTQENLKSLDSFKGTLAEELIEILRNFVRMFNKEKEVMKTEIDTITSEINMFKEHQNKFFSDIDQILNICRGHLTKNLEEITQDIKELKFQLKILTGRDIEEEEIEEYVLETYDDLDAFVPASLDAYSANNSMHVIESDIQKPESLLPTVTSILQSGLTWREDSIKTFIDVLEHLSEFKNKSLEVVTTCLENYFLVGEKRREENERMQHVFNSYDKIEESYVSKVCKDCLENVQFFNLEALNSIEFELDRLTNTIDLLQEEKNVIFNFCEKDFLYATHKIEEEVKNMNSDLSYLLFMGSAEGSELLSDCKDVLRQGVNDRNEEIHNLTSDHDSWSPESDVLQVLAVCGKHLKTCLEKRQLETQKMQELLNLIEEESNMSSLLYSPALEAVMEANNAFIEFLVPETCTFSYVQKELESKDKRLIEASQTLYCSMLETFKIERESISSDIEYLQDIRTEGAEITETESNEITVNFSDLFLTTFTLKKSELERNVHKKLIVEDVNKKKADILAAVKDVTKDEDIKENLSDEKLSIQEINETEKELKPFLQFDNYFEVRKQENKLKMDKKVIKEFLDLEVKLNAKVVETAIKSPSSLEDKSEKASEPDKDTEAFVNRVYEIKVQQIENEISLKRVKIGNVIKQRKYIMKNLIKSKRQEMEESVMLKEKQMQHMLDVVKSEDSQVICSLKDIFIDVVELKNKEKHSLKNKKELEKYLDKKLETKKVFVNLDTIFNAVLGIKEEELEMLKRSKFKEIEKLIKMMRREVKKRIVIAYDKLETALRKYRQYEKARALEYAGITQSAEQKGSEREEYSIPDEDIFPDIKSFKDFISTFKSPFGAEPKKSISIFKDVTSKADEIKPYIPFIRPHAYAMHGLAGHILKLYEGELQAFSKVLYDLKKETENAIQHGISFISEETPSNEETVNAAKR